MLGSQSGGTTRSGGQSTGSNRGNNAGNTIAIFPFGVFDKDAIVQLMGSGNLPLKSLRNDDTRAIVLTPESGIVTYIATYEAKTTFEVFVTTIYAKLRVGEKVYSISKLLCKKQFNSSTSS